MSPSSVARALDYLRDHNPHFKRPHASAENAVAVELGPDAATVVGEGFIPQTVDDALEKSGVDPRRYEVVKAEVTHNTQVVCRETADGVREPVSLPYSRVFLAMKPRAVRVDRVWEELLKDLRKKSPQVPAPKPPKAAQKSLRMLQVGVPDLHLGKWGAGYDMHIATTRALRSTGHFLSKLEAPPALVLMPIGNDLLHVDRADRKTVKGTDQDCEASPEEMFTQARRLLTEQIRMCLKVAPVRVVAVPGNHDQLAVSHLAHVIDAQFDSNKHVTVQFPDGDSLRTAFRFHKVLIGFTHGCKAGPATNMLGQVLAEEYPHDWAASQFREVHLGHMHQKIGMTRKFDTYNSVMLRWWPSLSGHDGWHIKKGYMAPPRAEAILWDGDHGIDETYSYQARD